MKLKGKVALITGAAGDRSIGWGIAQTLASEGANVVVNDLPGREDALNARVSTLSAQGYQAATAPADLTNPADVDNMVKQCVHHFGRLDILCSNAGMIRWESFLEITPAVLQAQVNVNVKGNLYACKAAADPC